MGSKQTKDDGKENGEADAGEQSKTEDADEVNDAE